ncbi:MAG: type II toxin-antitoxin system HicA family toxin [Flavobacteriales bacterium]|nr:type II toxin-antitoxin system HicA family toxin [Flavobacteriales bacterium]
MSKLPIVDARTFERVLLKWGFQVIRQKGSHVFYRHPDGRYTTLSHHKGQDISRPLIRKILNEIQVTQETFVSALEE